MRRYQVQVRGTFADSLGGWRPGITGTLNQTGQSDEQASTFADEPSADAAAALVLDEGARPDDVRVIEVQS